MANEIQQKLEALGTQYKAARKDLREKRKTAVMCQRLHAAGHAEVNVKKAETEAATAKETADKVRGQMRGMRKDFLKERRDVAIAEWNKITGQEKKPKKESTGKAKAA